MKFDDFSQKACCPYNKNHIFDREKYIFHLNRCKDRKKYGHLYASCQYNRIHIVPKQDLITHEIVCPDKADIKRLTEQLKHTLEITQTQRQRSREKLKKEEIKDEGFKSELKPNHENDGHIFYENCPLCVFVIEKFEEMKKIVPPQILTKIKTVEKMIKINNQLTQKLNKLDKIK